MQSRSLFVAVFLFAVALPVAAQNAGNYVVIQQRKFRLAHELVAGATFEPQDAFSKGLAAQLGYVWHLSDSWAWEVARAGYLTRFDTGLKDQLDEQFGVAPTRFENLRYFAGSALVYKPLYGKLAFRNASVVHVETFASIGANVGRFDTTVAVGPELGVGLRVFLSPAISLRLEVRDALYVTRDLTNVIFLSSGLAFSFGGYGR